MPTLSGCLRGRVHENIALGLKRCAASTQTHFTECNVRVLPAKPTASIRESHDYHRKCVMTCCAMQSVLSDKSHQKQAEWMCLEPQPLFRHTHKHTHARMHAHVLTHNSVAYINAHTYNTHIFMHSNISHQLSHSSQFAQDSLQNCMSMHVPRTS